MFPRVCTARKCMQSTELLGQVVRIDIGENIVYPRPV
jgi:hypothetical protein